MSTYPILRRPLSSFNPINPLWGHGTLNALVKPRFACKDLIGRFRRLRPPPSRGSWTRCAMCCAARITAYALNAASASHSFHGEEKNLPLTPPSPRRRGEGDCFGGVKALPPRGRRPANNWSQRNFSVARNIISERTTVFAQSSGHSTNGVGVI